MFGMMTGDRAEVTGDIAYNVMAARDSSIRKSERDINAIAAVDKNKVAVMVWNYHDLNLVSPPASVNILVKGLSATDVNIRHYRIDQENSNSYEAWKKMGSPQMVSEDQYKSLEQAGKLKMIEEPRKVKVKSGEVTISTGLEGQAVSLFVLEW
jgi:xylan 1,4-beta-xylosidase